MMSILLSVLRTSLEGSLYADHNGKTPSFISHSNAWVYNMSSLHNGVGIMPAKYYIISLVKNAS